MWSLLAALKDVIEQRKLVLQHKRELKRSNQLLKEAISKHQDALSEQANAEGETRATEQAVGNLQQRIKELQAELNHQNAVLQSQKESLEKCKSETETALGNMEIRQSEHEKNQQAYRTENESLELLVKEEHKGPEKKMIPLNDRDSSEQSSRIHALGDLHGWAPGLIGYLIHNNLAKIEISGEKLYSEDADGKISLNLEAMSKLFPDLTEYLTHAKEKEIAEDETVELFLHAGLLGQRAGTFNPRASYCDIDVEWVGKNEFFIQVGDIFDRADHSELSAEILRQMVLQAPAHVFVLVGNHEEFLLLDQYGGWLRNEKKWDYGRRGGNTRSLELLNPNDEIDPESTVIDQDFLLNDTYKKYQQSAAVLYFTQYFAQKKLTGDAFDDAPNFSLEELNSISERILSGTWDAYSAASEFHHLILERATAKPSSFPGAIASLGIGNSWFMHAEPNGLRKFFAELSKEEILELKTPTRLGNRELLILSMDVVRTSDEEFTSRCSELFWARDASSGFDALDSRFAHISSEIIKVLPGVRNIIHGHSPVPLKLDRNVPHTYLGRLLGNPVSPESGDIRVYNIDEGMTPVYQHEFEGNKIHSEAMPRGLQVPKVLEEYHTTGKIVSVDDLWDLSDMFLDEETVPFTVGYELTLNDTPDQYLVSGPGKIRVNPMFKDNQPQHVCTAEEKFRENPTKFSWLSVGEPETLSNPFKGKQPPPDGLYRVQNKTEGSMTLAENLLYLFETEAFDQELDKMKLESYDGKRAGECLGNYMGIDDIKSWSHLGKGIIHEGINCSTRFFTIQSTSSPAAINLSALNLGEDNFVIIVRNATKGSGKTSKTEVKIGSYLTQTITLAAPLSEVQVYIEETTSGSKSNIIFEGIFGPSKFKPIHSREEAVAKPPVAMLLWEPIQDGRLWKFTNEYRKKHTEKQHLLDSKTIKQGSARTEPEKQIDSAPVEGNSNDTERQQSEDEKPVKSVVNEENKAVQPPESLKKEPQTDDQVEEKTSEVNEVESPDVSDSLDEVEQPPESLNEEPQTDVQDEEKTPEVKEVESLDVSDSLDQVVQPPEPEEDDRQTHAAQTNQEPSEQDAIKPSPEIKERIQTAFKVAEKRLERERLGEIEEKERLEEIADKERLEEIAEKKRQEIIEDPTRFLRERREQDVANSVNDGKEDSDTDKS